jgi:DNA-binding transcriptional MerR regulator
MEVLESVAAAFAPLFMAEADDSARNEHTIDELAAVAKVPSRTIRFYQSRGALMAPEIRGRVAYYGPAHVERLKLIAQLQDRGLRIDAIRDLMASIDKGELDLVEWLGVEQEVQSSWSNDQPRTVTEDELYELAGSRRPGLLGELLRLKFAERHGDVFLLHSPALLAVAMKLEAAGVDLEIGAAAAGTLRKHMARAAEDLVEFFVSHADEGTIDFADVGKLFQELRATGIEAARVIFGREMERELRKLLESGKLAKLPGRARRAAKKKRA